MFDFSWSELMVIGVVALVLIGPKDMPVAIRAITRVLKRARRMAGEFQHHVDEMMRDADMGEVSDTLRSLRGVNLKSTINRMVDPDGTVGRAFNDPLAQHPVPPVMTARTPVRAEPVGGVVADSESVASGQVRGEPPPAFIPPSAALIAPVAAPSQHYLPPDFVPPSVARAEPTGDEF